MPHGHHVTVDIKSFGVTVSKELNQMSLRYPDVLKRFRQRHHEAEALERIMDQLARDVDIFKSYRTCLSIGTGYGEYDIGFIKRCLPNLEKLIVVERNRDCIEELKVSLKHSFGDKLKVEIHEESIETYMAKMRDMPIGGVQVDIVIAFHVLYFMSQEDRLELLNACFNSWLRRDAGGLFLYAITTENNDIVKIQKKFQTLFQPFSTNDDIRSDIETAGLKLWKEITYDADFELGIMDEDLLGIILAAREAPITKEMVKEATDKVVPSGLGFFEAAVGLVVGRNFQNLTEK